MHDMHDLQCLNAGITPGCYNTIFVSQFWKEFFKAYKVNLKFSTAYHPQTDGQSERVNQCLEMYLRCAVHDSPQTWKSWLPLAELWYNTSLHSSLGCTPFKALYGHDPDLGLLPTTTQTTSVSVTEQIENREQHIQTTSSKSTEQVQNTGKQTQNRSSVCSR